MAPTGSPSKNVSSASDAAAVRWRGAVLALFLLSGTIVSWNLDEAPLAEWDEGLSASRAISALETGEWWTVRFNGEADPRKPPLYYAILATGYAGLGVSELSTRLPGALAAIVVVLLVAALGRWIAGPSAGFLSGVVLATMPLFVERSRHANPDMVLWAASLGALLAFSRQAYLSFGVLVAVALFTKGAAGLFAPLTVALWIVATRDTKPLRSTRLWLGLGFAAVAFGGWFLWAIESEAFRSAFVERETIGRFIGQPSWSGAVAYYIDVIQLTFGPALLIVPFWLIVMFDPSVDDQRRRAFAPSAFLIGLGALAVVYPRHAHYAFFVMIPLALIVGVSLAELVERRRWITLGVAILLALAFGEWPEGNLLWPVLGITSVAIAVGALVILRPHGRGSWIFAPLLGGLLIVASTRLGATVRDDFHLEDLRELADRIRLEVPRESVLVTDRNWIGSLVYYSGRRVSRAQDFFLGPPPRFRRVVGVFESDLPFGIEGYTANVLAHAGSTKLIALDPSGERPWIPRVIERPGSDRTAASLELLGCTVGSTSTGEWVNHFASDCPSVAPLLDVHPVVMTDGETNEAEIDLGREAVVVGLRWPTNARGRVADWLAVEGSNDGISWRELARGGPVRTGYRLGPDGPFLDRATPIEVRFPAAKIRHLRVLVPHSRLLEGWAFDGAVVYADPSMLR